MGGFLKWVVSPTTMGVPTKNDHFGHLGFLYVPWASTTIEIYNG